MRSLIFCIFVFLMFVSTARPFTPHETLSPGRELIASDCGISWEAKIDPSDGFVKLRATNTCNFSVRFTVAVYAKDGTVNRVRNYCYAPGQTGVVVIGKGDWIDRVAVENLSKC